MAGQLNGKEVTSDEFVRVMQSAESVTRLDMGLGDIYILRFKAGDRAAIAMDGRYALVDIG
jgi:hypothetical protein